MRELAEEFAIQHAYNSVRVLQRELVMLEDQVVQDPEYSAFKNNITRRLTGMGNARQNIRISTAAGVLEFAGGIPTKETVRMVYDNLNLARAVEVFRMCASGVLLYRMRNAQRTYGDGKAGLAPFVFQARTAAQHHAIPRIAKYNAWSFIELGGGVRVVEVPAGVVGVVHDMWFHFVEDVGVTGRDAGRGGRYLLLPPRYRGPVPDGYFVVQAVTSSVCLFLRPAAALSLVSHEDVRPIIYGLHDDGGRCDGEPVDGSLLQVQDIMPGDKHFFDDLNRLVQEEPRASLDAEKRMLLASLGIVKDRPFRPSHRMKKILREATVIGSAATRAGSHQRAYPAFYEGERSRSVVSREVSVT